MSLSDLSYVDLMKLNYRVECELLFRPQTLSVVVTVILLILVMLFLHGSQK